MEKDLQLLSRIPLFRGIRTENLPEMLRCLNARTAAYGKQDIVLLAGQPAESVGIVLSGQVQVVREDFAGNRNILAEIPPGSLFAESYSCVRAGSLPVTVISTAESGVLWIDYRRIVTTCSRACRFHTKLIENTLEILASKNILLSRKIEHISKRTTREKLTAYLYDQAALHGASEFDIPFNRQELADYLCVDRSAMSNELCKMQREGRLRFHRSHFVLSPKSAAGDFPGKTSGRAEESPRAARP